MDRLDCSGTALGEHRISDKGLERVLFIPRGLFMSQASITNAIRRLIYLCLDGTSMPGLFKSAIRSCLFMKDRLDLMSVSTVLQPKVIVQSSAESEALDVFGR
jgi:hypothetical protein